MLDIVSVSVYDHRSGKDAQQESSGTERPWLRYASRPVQVLTEPDLR
jgi:hypothetical protein